MLPERAGKSKRRFTGMSRFSSFAGRESTGFSYFFSSVITANVKCRETDKKVHEFSQS
jgi:hypothetical protein